MSGKRWHAPSASPTPWDGTCDADLTPSQVAVRDSHRSACEFRHRTLSETGDASFFNRHVRERCPRCGDERVCRWGREADGVQRHGCGACGRTFTSSTGTIFEDHKLPVADWAESVGQAFGFESLEAMTREDRRSGTTTAWRVAKLFAVLRGIQDGVMLSGEARIDEKMHPLAAKDGVGGVAGMGAYSRDRICMAVGCDDAGRSLVARGPRQARQVTMLGRLWRAHRAGLEARARHGERALDPRRQARAGERGIPVGGPQGSRRCPQPAPPRQPHALPSEGVCAAPLRLQARPHRRLARPVLGHRQPTFQPPGEGGNGARSSNVPPHFAAIQRLL